MLETFGTILLILLAIFPIGGVSGEFGGFGYGFGYGFEYEAVGLLGSLLIVVGVPVILEKA
ncbi:MAG: DUF3309 domain-containing protein [Sneathiella sp.]|nr:DUF3309 domain-containing protein [Sneathiella sp.]